MSSITIEDLFCTSMARGVNSRVARRNVKLDALVDKVAELQATRQRLKETRRESLITVIQIMKARQNREPPRPVCEGAGSVP